MENLLPVRALQLSQHLTVCGLVSVWKTAVTFVVTITQCEAVETL